MAADKILIGPSSFAAHDPAPLKRLIDGGYAPVENPFKRRLTKAELLELLTPDVVGIIAGLEPLDYEVMTRSKLKVISRVGSGLSNVDLEGADKLRIAVRSTPAAPVQSVAELTLGALLSLLRQITEMDRELHAGRWEKRTGRLLAGKTVAIIGLGRIGRRVASLLRPFGVKLLAVDPALKGEVEGAEIVPLADALTRADIVSLHCAGEERVIGADELALMPVDSYLLNAARGGLVDETALLKAVESGRLAGAWVDAFGEEPYEGPLAAHRRVLLTPHAGSYSIECRKAMELEAVDNLLVALRSP